MVNESETMLQRPAAWNIYVAKLVGLLSSDVPATQIQFVEEAATTGRLQSEELGNRDPSEDASRNPGAPDTRIKPQYFTSGERPTI